MHHRDGGLARASDRLECFVVDLVVASRFGARAVALEFGDVGAGGEGLGAGTAKHDHAYVRIGLRLADVPRQRLPHIPRIGVETCGVVGDDRADAALDPCAQCRGRCLGRHVGS